MLQLSALIGAFFRAIGFSGRRYLSSAWSADQGRRSLRVSLVGVCLCSTILGFGLLAVAGVVPLTVAQAAPPAQVVIPTDTPIDTVGSTPTPTEVVTVPSTPTPTSTVTGKVIYLPIVLDGVSGGW